MAELNAELYAYDVEDAPDSFPLTYAKIANGQENDDELQALYRRRDLYDKKEFKFADETYNLIVREGKICIPKNLVKRAIDWYHQTLAHPGETRMELTLGQHYHWKGMHEDIKTACKQCHVCQLTKPKQKEVRSLARKAS